jgi:hypothetical protein
MKGMHRVSPPACFTELQGHTLPPWEQWLWPRDRDLMEMAEAVARGEYKPTPQQERALKLVIEYKYPKLAVMGHLANGQGFATMLERARKRSWEAKQREPKQIEHRRDETVSRSGGPDLQERAMNDDPQGLTTLGRCTGGLRLVSDRAKAWERAGAVAAETE